MSKAVRADADLISPATFAPLRNPTFRSIWLATQVSSLGWLMQTVAISWLMATICDFRSDGCAGPGFIEPAGFHFVPVCRGSSRQFQPSPGHVRRQMPYGDGFCDADRFCGVGLCRSVDDPRLQLPDRMRRRSQRSRLAGLGRRYRGPTRCSGCRDPALRRFQHRPNRRPGTRWHSW